MNPDLNVSLRELFTVSAVRGDLDLTNAAGAMSAIAALTARYQVVIVELSALEFIDCGALAALQNVYRCARQSGGDVVLAAPSVPVRRMLSLTGLDLSVAICDSAEAAIAGVSGRADRPEERQGAATSPVAIACPVP